MASPPPGTAPATSASPFQRLSHLGPWAPHSPAPPPPFLQVLLKLLGNSSPGAATSAPLLKFFACFGRADAPHATTPASSAPPPSQESLKVRLGTASSATTSATPLDELDGVEKGLGRLQEIRQVLAEVGGSFWGLGLRWLRGSGLGRLP